MMIRMPRMEWLCFKFYTCLLLMLYLWSEYILEEYFSSPSVTYVLNIFPMLFVGRFQ